MKEKLSIKNFLLFFIKKLRLSNPWNYKVPFLISIPYFIFLIGKHDGLNSWVFILASLAIIIGVAGLGYLTNDLGDREKDKLINKVNSTSNLSSVSASLLIALFFCLVLMPWYYLKFNIYSVILLSIQLFLFYAYAFKPIRLKERGFLGIISDALYAHVLPAVLSSYTFCLIVKLDFDKYLPFVSVLCAWQVCLGIRNIMFHQLKDLNNDIASQTDTFVTKLGLYKTEFFVKKIVLPLEILFFLFFLVYVSYYHHLFVFLVVMYWLYKFNIEKLNVRSLNYRSLSYKFLDDLYIQWLPLCVLILLCKESLFYLPVLILHFLLFRSEAKTSLLNRLNT